MDGPSLLKYRLTSNESAITGQNLPEKTPLQILMICKKRTRVLSTDSVSEDKWRPLVEGRKKQRLCRWVQFAGAVWSALKVGELSGSYCDVTLNALSACNEETETIKLPTLFCKRPLDSTVIFQSWVYSLQPSSSSCGTTRIARINITSQFVWI